MIRISLISFILAVITGVAIFFAWDAFNVPILRKRDLLAPFLIAAPLGLLALTTSIIFLIFLSKSTKKLFNL